MSGDFHVIIAGGGIGGLCLAHGLHKAGVSVAVYERDRPDERDQGYRIHINANGSRALHERLPPAQWSAFLGTAGRPVIGLGFVTEQMKELAFIEDRLPPDPSLGEYPVSRLMLLKVLQSGLEGIITFDKKLIRYEQNADGSVTAFFEDGTQATGNVLVGAEGIGSIVRKHYLPHAEVVDTGVVAVGGRFLLTAETRDQLSKRLITRLNNVLPLKDFFMFIAPFIRTAGAEQVTFPQAGQSADTLPDHGVIVFFSGKYTLSPKRHSTAFRCAPCPVLGVFPRMHFRPLA